MQRAPFAACAALLILTAVQARGDGIPPPQYGELQQPGVAPAEPSKGYAIIKKHAWSKSTEISDVIFYDTFTSGPIYTNFRQGGKEIQVDTGCVIGCCPMPGEEAFQEITTDQEIAAVASQLQDLQKLCASFPPAKTRLGPIIIALQKDVTLYQQGSIKIDGAWILKTQWQKNELEKQALEAKRNADFEAAETKARLEEKHKTLRLILVSPTSNLAMCEKAAADLATLNDPADQDILKPWAGDRASVVALQQEMQRFLDSVRDKKIFPGEDIKAVADVKLPPEQIEKEAAALNSKYARLQSKLQFPQLIDVAGPEQHCVALVIHLCEVEHAINKNDIYGAIDAMKLASLEAGANTPADYAALAKQADKYGAFLGSLQHGYDSHMSNARDLEVAGRKDAAIKEYEEAYKMIAQPDILTKIKDLKQQSLGL